MSAETGRPWRCWLCPTRGVGADPNTAFEALETHYQSRHMGKKPALAWLAGKGKKAA